jgi:hypothetical protein
MKPMRLCCALLTLFSPLLAFAQSPISDDAYVSNASGSVASSNNGTSPALVVQASSGYSYIRFDLSKVLPLTSQTYPIQSNMVAKATMKLYLTAVTAGGTVDALEVAGPWCERTGESSCPSTGGITYTTRPVDGIQIAGSSSATGVPSIPISTTVVANNYTTGQYVTLDVTQAVKDWIDYANGTGGHPNYGIVLKPSSGSSVSATFESKESTTTGHDASLHIVLSGPQGIQGPVGTTGAVGPIGPAGPQPTITTNGGLLITGTNANGTENLTLDSTVAATQAGSNTFSGANTFTGADLFKNKVDMSGATGTLPLQAVSAQPNGNCATANAMQLWTGGASGQQIYVCRQTNPGNPQSLAWSNANDDSALSSSVAAETVRAEGAESTLTTSVAVETTRATGAETTLTSNLNAESSRAQGAEATLTNNLATETTRATGAETGLSANLAAESAARSLADAVLGTSISSEASRATAAESTLTSNVSTLQSNVTTLNNTVATKAANSFTGTQTIGPAAGATAPADSNALALQSLNSSNQANIAQWTMTKAGLLSLQIGVNGATPQQQLSFNPDGTINFVASQSFPGNATSVTNGVYTTGSYANPSWITSLAGSKITGDISGNAASIMGSITESQVTNLSMDLSALSGSLATKATAASITGGTNTKITYNAQGIVTGGAQAASTDLSDTAAIVRNAQANIYTAGMKQTFTPSAQTAGVALAGINSADPIALAAGDLWFRTDLKRLRLYDGTASHSVMFSDDSVSNTQLLNNSVTINTASGSGLSGGGALALGSALSLSVPSAGITNAMLANNSVTITAGSGLSGGGSVTLGQAVTLANAGVTSLTGTANQVTVSASSGAVTLSVPKGIANGVASLDATTKVPVSQLPAGTANGVASLDSSGKVPVSQLPSTGVNGGVSGPSTITVTPGLINKTTCADITPTGAFTGLSTSLVISLTPVGALNAADWGRESITWTPYVSASNALLIHFCNGLSTNLTFTSQSFNIRFIN